MAEEDGMVRAASVGDAKPGEMSRGGFLRVPGKPRQGSCLGTGAKAGEGAGNGDETLISLQPRAPVSRGAMKECFEKCPMSRSGQDDFDFTSQLNCFIDRPLRQESGMHHEVGAFTVVQRLPAQPVHQFLPIVGIQYIMDRIFLPRGNDALRHGEQE